MPFYNSRLYLEEAVRSILSQTFTDFELILIDDGSTDGSADIVTSIHDKRIKLVKNPKNMGLIATLNKGLDLAIGKYIARMDADDIALPERLKIQLEFLENNPQVIVCGTQIRYFGTVNSNSKLYEKDEEIKSSLIFGSCFAHPTVMMRTEVLRKNNLYYENNHLHLEDYDLWLRMRNYGEYANINTVLLNYRIGEQNITQINKDSREKRMKSIYADVLRSLNIDGSEDNCNLLYELSFNSKKIKNFKKLARFKNMLIQQNEAKNFYNHEAFKKIIEENWNRLFYISADMGWCSAFSYIGSGGSLSIGKIRYLVSKKSKNG